MQGEHNDRILDVVDLAALYALDWHRFHVPSS